MVVVAVVPILSVAIVAVVVAVIEAKKKIQQQGMMVPFFLPIDESHGGKVLFKMARR